MSYQLAMEAAGASVKSFKEFGSYQGTWAALVEYKGQTGIAEGSYGSCSGCDAFQGEFDFQDYPFEKDGKYYFGQSWDDDEEHEIPKDEYEQKKQAYDKKLSDFGASYLQNLSDKQILETRLENMKKEDWFSDEEKEVIAWSLEQLNTALTVS